MLSFCGSVKAVSVRNFSLKCFSKCTFILMSSKRFPFNMLLMLEVEMLMILFEKVNYNYTRM